MENWCWERSGLDLFAATTRPGERIPDELYEKMVARAHVPRRQRQMRQLGFAAVDLALHQEYDAARDGDAMAYGRSILAGLLVDPICPRTTRCSPASATSSPSRRLRRRLLQLQVGRGARRRCLHPVQEGRHHQPEVGRAFRDAILSKGNSEDPAKLYRDFMGRGPELDPLLERTGLSSRATSRRRVGRPRRRCRSRPSAERSTAPRSVVLEGDGELGLDLNLRYPTTSRCRWRALAW